MLPWRTLLITAAMLFVTLIAVQANYPNLPTILQSNSHLPITTFGGSVAFSNNYPVLPTVTYNGATVPVQLAIMDSQTPFKMGSFISNSFYMGFSPAAGDVFSLKVGATSASDERIDGLWEVILSPQDWSQDLSIKFKMTTSTTAASNGAEFWMINWSQATNEWTFTFITTEATTPTIIPASSNSFKPEIQPGRNVPLKFAVTWGQSGSAGWAFWVNDVSQGWTIPNTGTKSRPSQVPNSITIADPPTNAALHNARLVFVLATNPTATATFLYDKTLSLINYPTFPKLAPVALPPQISGTIPTAILSATNQATTIKLSDYITFGTVFKPAATVAAVTITNCDNLFAKFNVKYTKTGAAQSAFTCTSGPWVLTDFDKFVIEIKTVEASIFTFKFQVSSGDNLSRQSGQVELAAKIQSADSKLVVIDAPVLTRLNLGPIAQMLQLDNTITTKFKKVSTSDATQEITSTMITHNIAVDNAFSWADQNLQLSTITATASNTAGLIQTYYIEAQLVQAGGEFTDLRVEIHFWFSRDASDLKIYYDNVLAADVSTYFKRYTTMEYQVIAYGPTGEVEGPKTALDWTTDANVSLLSFAPDITVVTQPTIGNLKKQVDTWIYEVDAERKESKMTLQLSFGTIKLSPAINVSIFPSLKLEPGEFQAIATPQPISTKRIGFLNPDMMYGVQMVGSCFKGTLPSGPFVPYVPPTPPAKAIIFQSTETTDCTAFVKEQRFTPTDLFFVLDNLHSTIKDLTSFDVAVVTDGRRITTITVNNIGDPSQQPGKNGSQGFSTVAAVVVALVLALAF